MGNDKGIGLRGGPVIIDLDYEELEFRVAALLSTLKRDVLLVAELDEKRVQEQLLNSLSQSISMLPEMKVPVISDKFNCRYPGCKKDSKQDGYCGPNHRQLHHMRRRNK